MQQINYLSGTTIDLLLDLVEFASNMSSVAIQDWRVSVADLSGVVEDNDLKNEEKILFQDDLTTFRLSFLESTI